MANPEWKRVEAHMNRVFRTKDVILKPRAGVKDSMEVYLGAEFLGTVYIDEDEGETSYIFEMAILDIDLEE
ncbi:MAG: hypothetical protein CFE27_12265 [Alphaproteobacteria bacterium PA1]|nr:MAG: hypothetical protein CFE27_12265 [Alphaproteobacteria bacterium PA1]